MHLAVYLPLVMPLLAAVAARPLVGRLPPRAAAWLLVLSAIALALASSAVLGLLALTALIRIPLVDSLTGMSGLVISRHDPASVPVATIAGAVLAAAAVTAGRALWRRARALIAASREARELPGAGQVVLTEDEAADAYTLPGLPCRIVVTAGMLRALAAPEREVLLAHERAHASGVHYLFTTAARLAAAANPLLYPVASAVGYCVERWADERAATLTGDRKLAARAIARAARATTAAPPRRLGRTVTALGAVSLPARHRRVAARLRRDVPVPRHVAARFRWAGPVPRRVAAVLGPAGPVPRRVAAVLGPAGPVPRRVAAVLGPAGPVPRRVAAVLRPAGPVPRRVAAVLRPAGPVPRRVAALLRPPPRPHLLMLFGVVLLVAISGFSALEAARDLHALLESARAATQ